MTLSKENVKHTSEPDFVTPQQNQDPSLKKSEQDLHHDIIEALKAARALSDQYEEPTDSDLSRLKLALKSQPDEILAAILASGLVQSIDEAEEIKPSVEAMLSGEVRTPTTKPPVQRPQRIEPKTASAAPLAEKLNDALGTFAPAHLEGRHTKNSFFLTTEDGLFLIKQDLDAGPVKGMTEEPVSAPVREAAFHDIAEIMGLGKCVPEVRLILVDGHEAAAIQFLHVRKWVPAQDLQAKHPANCLSTFEALRQEGILFKWSVMDYVLGNGDRHGHNVLVSDKFDTKLIDHGSTMAGDSFSPQTDFNVFTPWYLRYRVDTEDSFEKMPRSKKLEVMPTMAGYKISSSMTWLRSLDENAIGEKLREYGIDPSPILRRLAKIKQGASPSSLSRFANELWV